MSLFFLTKFRLPFTREQDSDPRLNDGGSATLQSLPGKFNILIGHTFITLRQRFFRPNFIFYEALSQDRFSMTDQVI